MSPAEPVHILIVEDNAADFALIKALLARVQTVEFRLDHAQTLSAGVDVLQRGSTDAVLLDLSLPDSRGTGGCVQFRRRFPAVPIVVLTGIDDEDLAIEALRRGAQDYLVKGRIDSNALGRSIRYAIQRQRMEVELQRAHDELEKRVEQRTAELLQANEQLRREISQRQRAEELARQRQEELAHVARLNTLGEMASNLAHELNQPLTAIVAYARSCLRRVRSGQLDGQELIDELEKAAAQAKRGGEIIKRLRRLVSKRQSAREPTDINQSVRNVADFVELESGAKGIGLKLELGNGLPKVEADRIQIEQVLLNLVRNGFDAMADCEPRQRELTISSAIDAQGNVVVSVRDRGHGADVDRLSRMFEPFFSTKERGLGLGLSISRSIIEAHLGRISVARNGDRGLEFQFTLPVNPQPVDDIARSPNADESLLPASNKGP